MKKAISGFLIKYSQGQRIITALMLISLRKLIIINRSLKFYTGLILAKIFFKYLFQGYLDFFSEHLIVFYHILATFRDQGTPSFGTAYFALDQFKSKRFLNHLQYLPCLSVRYLHFTGCTV